MSLMDELRDSDILEIKYNTKTYKGTKVTVEIKKKGKGYSAVIKSEKAPEYPENVGNRHENTLDDIWKEIRIHLNG